MAHRHNPYAGYTMPNRRGGGSPAGPGPDRQRQFERGGRPPRGRRGGHNQFAHQQDHGYGNTGSFAESPYARNDALNEFNPYQSYENDQSYGYQEPHKPESEDKGSNPLIEERLQRERPCRTLFIRNIKYETDSTEFRRKFEEFGEIKTFFDLISHRGMVFCTYFDSRAAERAKERLQGTELAGRPIDVHYSLPREDQSKERNQGILVVSLVESPSRIAIDDNELRRKCQVFGDVKSITPYNGRHDARYVEFYDIRSCEEAQIKLRHQNLQDGIIETDFGDTGDSPLPPGPAMVEHGQARADGRYEPPTNNRGRGRGGRGGRGRQERGRWGEFREDEFGRHENRPLSPPRGRFGGRDPRDLSPERRGFVQPELSVDPAEQTRREQAKKVQDLLDALKGTSSSASQPPQSSAPPLPPPGPSQSWGYQPPNPAVPPPVAASFANPLAALLNPATLSSLLQGQLGQSTSPNGAPGAPPVQPALQQAYEQLLRAALPQLTGGAQSVAAPPTLPPPSAMFPGHGPPPSLPPFPPQHPPAHGLPPPSRPPSSTTTSPSNAYDSSSSASGLPLNILQLLGQQQQSHSSSQSQGGGNESSSGYNPYNRPTTNGSSASQGAAPGPPANIQDMLALLQKQS